MKNRLRLTRTGLSRRRRSWIDPRAGYTCSSIGACPLDRPDDGYISNADRLRDLRAVHEPDRHIAAGVMPEKVALAVAVEVAGLDDRPHRRRRSADRRLSNQRAVHHPHRHGAAGAGPDTVALPAGV